MKSCARLVDDFWILNRSIDADGADIVIQPRFSSSEVMRKRREHMAAFGFVQAKFFEGKNQVRLAKRYIHNDGGAVRRDFFVFVHTLDSFDNAVDYFFSATEVVHNWETTKNGDFYYFALTAGRSYENFKNISRADLREKVESGIFEHIRHVLRVEVSRTVSFRASTRSEHYSKGRYILCRPHGCPVALYLEEDGAGHVVEARKDIFQSCGWFEWGCLGEGPKLLAASIFSHFFCGLRPSSNEIVLLCTNLVGVLNRNFAEISEMDIFAALAGLPYKCEFSSHPAVQEQFDQTKAKYGEFLQSSGEW